ncbi:MAG: zinc ABC transporter substrate-binding protein, partial [Glaciimonas sp.]|nr:zinc ABC transporter substrate-binding protein [Glaciimonas sp.]
MTRIKILLLSALFVFSSAAMASPKIPVVASFSILGDIVSNIGGDRIAVTNLVGPDQDAHIFTPSPKDVRTLTQAKLVVVNGLGFEGWIQRLTGAANYKGVLVIASDGVKTHEMSEDGHHHGHADHAAHADPHAWQDPT